VYARPLTLVDMFGFMYKNWFQKIRSNTRIEVTGRYRKVRGDDRKVVSEHGLLTPAWSRVMTKKTTKLNKGKLIGYVFPNKLGLDEGITSWDLKIRIPRRKLRI